jgi:hypothetical protein
VLEKGEGTYLMMFFKTDEGLKTYRGSAVCQTATGRSLTAVLKKIETEDE